MTVRFLAVARRELAGQLAYMNVVAPAAGPRLRAAVKYALDLLEAGGVDGPELMLRDGRRVRRWLVPPLVLFYVREKKGVLVVRVRHGAQRPITRR
ncbi:MAG TPA: type II toxin-antitoxin system RelE/ParE family toxin [Polyangiaceae bacterium]|nr:type II toxin-antitoxin system RelE/ParE family toxin [Polyangiaceae bacterium]